MTSELTYRIVVSGELGGWLAHYLGGATIAAADGHTTISGRLERPRELHDLTVALCDLGLEIESAKLIA